MRGKTTCPDCKHSFTIDLPARDEKHEIVCPKCKKKFNVKVKCTEEECTWEEHGEPRKTILSKNIAITNKPMIAAILLTCVFILGVTTSVYSEEFIVNSLDVASGIGLKGNVKITTIDIENNSVSNATIIINNISRDTNSKGIANFKDIELGIQTMEVSKEEYFQKQEILVTPFISTEIEILVEEENTSEETIEFDTLGCTFIILIFSVFALLGAIACFKRRNLDVAVAGSIIGIFSFGFFLIGLILSIIAFVLIMKSRDEFRDAKKGRVF
jgi:hypothetical protein